MRQMYNRPAPFFQLLKSDRPDAKQRAIRSLKAHIDMMRSPFAFQSGRYSVRDVKAYFGIVGDDEQVLRTLEMMEMHLIGYDPMFHRMQVAPDGTISF